MRPDEIRALKDLDAGRAVVVLSDGNTFDPLRGCQVRFYDAAEDWEDGDPPTGYHVVGLDVLVRHFLQTQP